MPIAKEAQGSEAEPLDLVKDQAAKLTASISSSTRVPSVADVAKAIEHHNSNASELSTKNADTLPPGSPIMDLGSRKHSRKPSLDTVNEDYPAALSPQEPVGEHSVIKALDAQDSNTAKSRLSQHPSIARLKTEEVQTGLGLGDDSHGLRKEGMKSLSILETEGLPQLVHEVKVPTSNTIQASGSPGVRMVRLCYAVSISRYQHNFMQPQHLHNEIAI